MFSSVQFRIYLISASAAVVCGGSHTAAAQDGHGVGAGNWGDGTVSTEPSPPAISALTSAERSLVRSWRIAAGLVGPDGSTLHPSLSAVGAAVDDDVTHALGESASGEVAAVVRLTRTLDSAKLLLPELVRLPDTERQEGIAAIAAELEAVAAPLAEEVRERGGEVVGGVWLGGAALVVHIDALHLEALRRRADVDRVHLVIEGGEPGVAYTGDDSTNATGMMTDALWWNGWSGQTQNRTNSAIPMRIGIIEHTAGNYALAAHYAWQDGPGPTRVKATKDCQTGVCLATTPTNVSNHGQWVASVAAGSIIEGQDPSFPGIWTLAQRQRTGHAREAEIYAYNINTSGAMLAVALQQAVIDGVDIVNMSFSYGGQYKCDYAQDFGTSNQALRDALDAGIVPIGITGNNQIGAGCEIAWPGLRPEVVAVAGSDTSDDTVPFRDTDLSLASTHLLGGVPATARGGYSFAAAAVDLVAPGVVRRVPAASPGSYSGQIGGSSFAAPAVAGTAAIMLEGFRDAGWPTGSDPRRLMNNLYLLGDAWNGADVLVPGGSVKLTGGVSAASGFGRLRARSPISPATGLASPWYWSDTWWLMYNGTTAYQTINGGNPMPAGITEFKVVAAWYPTDLTSVDDVTISVLDTCAGGGAIANDMSFDFRKRIRLPGATVVGRCLQLKLHGYSIKPGGVKVYVSHFWHGGVVDP